MISDKWIYVLNSAGWALAGMVFTLSYQRLAMWWHERKHQKVKSPLSPQAYLGMIIVMISLISAAFSGAGQIQTSRNAEQVKVENAAFQAQVICQNKINASNAVITAERGRRSQQDTDAAEQLFKAQEAALTGKLDASTLTKIIDAFNVYEATYQANSAYRAKNVLTPLTVCGPPVKPATK